MSSIDEKIKHKLKIFILRKRQQKQQQEMRREVEEEIDYVQRAIYELQNKKHLLIQKFKWVLDEEMEIERQRYIKKFSN